MKHCWDYNLKNDDCKKKIMNTDDDTFWHYGIQQSL